MYKVLFPYLVSILFMTLFAGNAFAKPDSDVICPVDAKNAGKCICQSSIHHRSEPLSDEAVKNKLNRIFKHQNKKIKNCFEKNLSLVSTNDVSETGGKKERSKLLIDYTFVLIFNINSDGYTYTDLGLSRKMFFGDDMDIRALSDYPRTEYTNAVLSCLHDMFKDISFCPGKITSQESDRIVYNAYRFSVNSKFKKCSLFADDPPCTESSVSPYCTPVNDQQVCVKYSQLHRKMSERNAEPQYIMPGRIQQPSLNGSSGAD